MANAIQEHIELTPGILGGKPKIAGHRVSVSHIVVLYEKLGMSADEVVQEILGITLADVHAAMAYYYDNQSDIDQSILDQDTLIAKMKAQSISKIRPA